MKKTACIAAMLSWLNSVQAWTPRSATTNWVPPLPPTNAPSTNRFVHRVSSQVSPLDSGGSWSVSVAVVPSNMDANHPGDYFVNGGTLHSNWNYTTILYTQLQECNPTNAAWPFNSIRVLGNAIPKYVIVDDTLLTITATATFCDGTTTNGTLIVKVPGGWGGSSKFIVQVAGDTSLDWMGITGGFSGMGGIHIPADAKPSISIPPKVPPQQGHIGYQGYQFAFTWSNSTPWIPDPTWAQMAFPADDNSTNVLYRATHLSDQWESVDTNVANNLGIVQFFEPANNVTTYYRINK